jgi:hypothetical protein
MEYHIIVIAHETFLPVLVKGKINIICRYRTNRPRRHAWFGATVAHAP